MVLNKEKGRGKKRKQNILQAFMRLFVKKGSYSATSTADICSAAHISRPILHHYFGNKSNLLLSLHFDHISRVLEPYLEQASLTTDPLDRVTYMVRTYTGDIICQHPELRFLIHNTPVMRDKHFREVRQQWKKHYQLLRTTIIELQGRGIARKELNPSSTALFLLGMMTWVTF